MAKLKRGQLSIVECEETIKIIMNSGTYSTRKGDIMEKLHSQIQDFKNFHKKDELRMEVKQWLQDCKEYGFIEGNPLISRAQKLFKEIIKEDDEKIL